MARETFALVMPHLFRHEGGFVDHPRDPGGATNYGITIGTLRDWRGQPVTKDDVRNLTKEEAAQIYRARYWNVVKGDELPAGVDYAVFDAAVNSGPARGARWLQGAVGAAQDGVIGPATLRAVSGHIPLSVVEDVCNARLAFVKSLSTWDAFGAGWSRRISEVRSFARSLAHGAREPETPQPPPLPDNAVSNTGLFVFAAAAAAVLIFVATQVLT